MESEEFKRPDHNDFKFSSELKAENFSGTRLNSITGMIELWVLGEMKGEARISDPKDVEELFKKYFLLTEVKIADNEGAKS